MTLRDYFFSYTSQLSACVAGAKVTNATGAPLVLDAALMTVIGKFRKAHAAGGKIIFIGNGGSAAIASHQAFDYWKNGKMRATCFNDASLLTGSANDFGYPGVFSNPLAMFATEKDVVVAISSSGKSENILHAAREARRIGCFVFTLSAFGPDNPLRALGDVNVYLDTMVYGHAELGHETILHTMLDYTIFGEQGPSSAIRSRNEKIKTPAELAGIVEAARTAGRTVVQCHGVFDLVHLGHINYFEQSRRLGNLLFVGVIADRFVRKGPDRPRFPERQRMEWIAALESVDYVVLNEEEGPWSLMRLLRPNVDTKGEGEREKLNVPGSGLLQAQSAVEAVGGRLMFTPELPIHSTDILDSLR